MLPFYQILEFSESQRKEAQRKSKRLKEIVFHLPVPNSKSRVSKSAGRSAGQGSPGPGPVSRSLRTALIFGSFISLIGAAFYPIYFRPLMRLEEYKKEQAINRAGIVQEDVQPPGLKVWSDPFGRK
ncbi:small integral membrane protein 20 [Nomascus leucogenys]|uniref:small integral membrane protein 20 n=1 Tax=Nomascus leucogenys TaxID=61853 RepID=UPI00122D740F|nr:small integral membrane protein 20 [Nomascus leucogenys]